jgi:Putative restriction endonuclease
MAMLVLDRVIQKAIIRDRRTRGLDRFDEVWNGVYVMSPIANVEHQFVAGKIHIALDQAMNSKVGAIAYPAINISDRSTNWRKNFRCPDASVFLPGNPAKLMGAYWLGGPDFAVEVISPRDRSRKKLDFYTKVGVGELLLVDRKPWSLELYRLIVGEQILVGKLSPDPTQSLVSQVLPVSFRLLPGDPRPTIEVTQTEDARQWLI